MNIPADKLSPQALENLHFLASVATIEERSIGLEPLSDGRLRELAVRKHALSFGAAILVVDELVGNTLTGNTYRDPSGDSVQFYLNLDGQITKFKRFPKWYEASGIFSRMSPSHRKEQKRRAIRAAEHLALLTGSSMASAKDVDTKK
ncbi:MAG: hypothetical protein WA843_04515 [Candidatus Saccharimonadales bacterium]